MNSTKKYNIFFILNSPYFKFGKVLLGSIFNTCNMKRIEKIYVLPPKSTYGHMFVPVISKKETRNKEYTIEYYLRHHPDEILNSVEIKLIKK